MSTVSIRELTRNASSVVDEVTRTGRPALVTKRGQLVAAVVPIDSKDLEDYVLAHSPKIIASLAEADADLQAGRAVSLDDFVAEKRQQAVAGALGSVRAEGIDPSGAEPDLKAWASGQIDTGEMIARGLTAATGRHGPPEQPAA